ncbi:MAG TPA: response regulator [Desulfomonilia bacterium]|nr:response regulator [Desulfomonilia bacterium]
MNLFEEIRDKKILLIDDDETIRDSMSMFFLGEGIPIDTLETGEEGIKALEKQHYDIIITDYRLPGMDGLTFLRRIRELCPDSFRILITAYRSKEVLAAAARLGADEYIEKPFTTKLIKDALSRYVERRR